MVSRSEEALVLLDLDFNFSSHKMANTIAAQALIQSTAGAIAVKNDKGDVSMQKVKVHRYVSGKRPDYATLAGSDDESDDEFGFDLVKGAPQSVTTEIDDSFSSRNDARLRRLQRRNLEEDIEDRIERHRHIHEPEVLDEDSEEQEDVEMAEVVSHRMKAREEMEESSDEEDLDEEEIEKRRMLIRMKAKERQEEEVLAMEEEAKSEAESSEEESSEYEEYTDSEEETGPRLKPVFVRKRDRITVQEKEKQLLKQKELEMEAKKAQEERRRASVKLVEQEARKEIMEEHNVTNSTDVVITDDDNDEVEYEAWKLRELKRIKRDKEEKEMWEKEKMELEKIHSMTEEERRANQRQNPKLITNKAAKGKYRFLQKYYHRGAFYLDDEQNVYKRDFAEPTLEDHCDKTILPKVMQVKNFGRSGRTKYTHLVDHDTTQFDSAWTSDAAQKFHFNKGGGMKQVFERPSNKRK